jgi:hypothetical protein
MKGHAPKAPSENFRGLKFKESYIILSKEKNTPKSHDNYGKGITYKRYIGN